MNRPKVIVIDHHSVSSEGGLGPPLAAAGLKAYVERELGHGSTVYIISGQSRDPWVRQKIEQFLELAGIRHVHVIHSLPDQFDLFLSIAAYKFEGTFPE